MMALIEPVLPLDDSLQHLITTSENGLGETYLRLWTSSVQTGSWWMTDEGTVIHPLTDLQPGFHHLAGVYRGNRWLVFLDGVLLDSTVEPTGALGAVGSWYFGGYLGRVFLGKMREVRVYDRGLSNEEIAALANSVLAP